MPLLAAVPGLGLPFLAPAARADVGVCAAIPASVSSSVPASDLAARVVLLVNADAPDSLAIARHYAQARGVPPANIISLHLPVAETVTWSEFVGTLWNPLQQELIRREWLEAVPTDLRDRLGRSRTVINGSRIAALVVCRGVPLRISEDAELMEDAVPSRVPPELRTNRRSVDSELSLLAQSAHPVDGPEYNPLFGVRRPAAGLRTSVVEVSRLDGPTSADANVLVDRAVAAEAAGLSGRAVVDEGYRYAQGDRWLESDVRLLSSLGFEMTVDRLPTTLPETARCDQTALYFGWYAADLNGPFALPGFRFAPGAIALHIHSFSAETLHSTSHGWCGPLVDRGVTATVGNVYEPYLDLTHRPDMLLEALARGATWAEAVYYALPVLSWQGVCLGDPLYRPFAVSALEQARRAGQGGSGPSADYALLRWMNLLDAAGHHEQAVLVGREGLRRHPEALALAVGVARRLESTGERREAAALIVAAEPDPQGDASPGWALRAESAERLVALGDPAAAVAVYRRLLALPELPSAERATWLVGARAAAVAAGDSVQSELWRREATQSVQAILNER